MKNREFGRTGIYLSPLTFGSMRLDPKNISLDQAVRLVTQLNENGLNTFHSSHEYESYPFFCKVMKEFCRTRPSTEIVHVSKIAVPHFDESTFTSTSLVNLIEDQLRALNTERLDIVQWLVRHQPNEDGYRLAILAQCQDKLSLTWERLQHEGKVGVLTSFPYSAPFAKEVLKFPLCKGLVTYLNPLELEMVQFLDEMEEAGQGYIAIRPFYAGLITTRATNVSSDDFSLKERQKLNLGLKTLNVSKDSITCFATQFPLLHPTVSSVMLSLSSLEHANEVIDAVNNVVVDRNAFNKVVNCFLSC